MIAEAEIETPPQAAMKSPFESTLTEAAPSRDRVKLLLDRDRSSVLVAIGAGWYLYSRGYESTDDAQVDGH